MPMQDSNKALKRTSAWADVLCLREDPSATFLIILRDVLLLTSMFSGISPFLGSDLALEQDCFSRRTWDQLLAQAGHHSSSLRWTLEEEEFPVGFSGSSTGTPSNPHGLK